ncbi:MAG: hypothetical protein BGO12_17715 [Verrucomicrobia bacterium 61-8]|nr:MAG: hypothetical protein BGO12_17715 [Verrucomicrobia bacterium 61-8]
MCYTNYGRVGVAIFFMITGFLFTGKILKARGKLDWCRLYESRVFRIIPLYLFVLGCISLIVFIDSGFVLKSSPGELFHDYWRWLQFQSGSINRFPCTNLIIAGVEWTLRYEWAFYLSLPLLALVLSRGSWLLTGSLVLLCITLRIYPRIYGGLLSGHFLLFAVGCATARLVTERPGPMQFARSHAGSFLAVGLLIAAIVYPITDTRDLVHVALIAGFFIIIAFGNSLFGLLRWKSVLLLGEISFSIYLIHGLVLYLLFTHLKIADVSQMDLTGYSFLMPFVASLVIASSALTFLFIERPFIDLGKEYRISRGLGLVASLICRPFMRRAPQPPQSIPDGASGQ